MASLAFYIGKYGEIRGRKAYNTFHRRYRKANKPRMLEYWKSRREAQKANKDGASRASELSPAQRGEVFRRFLAELSVAKLAPIVPELSLVATC
jgi:hypothetical protein